MEHCFLDRVSFQLNLVFPSETRDEEAAKFNDNSSINSVPALELRGCYPISVNHTKQGRFKCRHHVTFQRSHREQSQRRADRKKSINSICQEKLKRDVVYDLFSRPCKYSGDLNTRLVWYSNGQKLSDSNGLLFK